jgi:hypothetical protein
MSDSWLDAHPAPRPDGLIVHVLDGEAVIFSEHDQQLHHLDPIATCVWGLLDGATPLSVTVAELAEAFGVAAEVVTADVRTLVETLLSADLLVRGVAP